MKKRETLWMRYVDFNNIKDMLHLVHENDSELRAGTLEQLAIKKGILVKKENGRPLAHSPRYHYRKVLEGLGLVEVKEKFYYIPKDKQVSEFIRLTEFKRPLSPEAKEILREIIVENCDCRKYFFDTFMEEGTYTLKDIRKQGKYVIVETKSMRELPRKRMEQQENIRKRKKVGTVIFGNPFGETVELKTQDEIHSIYWGVRLWALKLEITNELLTSFSEGRIIYPVNPDFSDEVLTGILLNKVKEVNSDSEWTVLHIPTFIKEVALSTRFPVDKIKKFLLELKTKYPLSIMFIPASTMFIDITTPFPKQDLAIRNSYLYQGGVYISHLRINKKIKSGVMI
jgi:hypothetical protein